MSESHVRKVEFVRYFISLFARSLKATEGKHFKHLCINQLQGMLSVDRIVLNFIFLSFFFLPFIFPNFCGISIINIIFSFSQLMLKRN